VGTPYNPPGFTASTSYIASTNGGVTPANSLTNPFPNGLAQPTGSSLGDLTGIGQSMTIFDSHSNSPRVQQYSLTSSASCRSESRSRWDTSVALHTSHTGDRKHQHQRAESELFFDGCGCAHGTGRESVLRKGGAGVIGSATVTQAQLLLPFPEFGAINLTFSDQSHARYDSLVMKAQKRLSMGLTFLSTLTCRATMTRARAARPIF